MKFRRSAPVVLITSALMVIATISLVSNLLSHRMAAAFAHNNRDGLLAAIQDAYQVLRENYGLSQAQFHLAVATDFIA